MGGFPCENHPCKNVNEGSSFTIVNITNEDLLCQEWYSSFLFFLYNNSRWSIKQTLNNPKWHTVGEWGERFEQVAGDHPVYLTRLAIYLVDSW